MAPHCFPWVCTKLLKDCLQERVLHLQTDPLGPDGLCC